MVITCVDDGQNAADSCCACRYPLPLLCADHAQKHNRLDGFHFVMPLEAAEMVRSEVDYQSCRQWLFKLTSNIEVLRKKQALLSKFSEHVEAIYQEASYTLLETRNRLKAGIDAASQAYDFALDSAINEVRANALNYAWQGMSNSLSQMLWYYDSAQLESYVPFDHTAESHKNGGMTVNFECKLWGFEQFSVKTDQETNEQSQIGPLAASETTRTPEEEAKSTETPGLLPSEALNHQQEAEIQRLSAEFASAKIQLAVLDTVSKQLADAEARIKVLEHSESSLQALCKQWEEIANARQKKEETRSELTPMQKKYEEIVGSVPDYMSQKCKEAMLRLGRYPVKADEAVLVTRAPVMIPKIGVYEGQWNSRGQRHGFGVMKMIRGDVYEGYWRDDEMMGKGRYIWGDSGEVHEGDFVKNRAEGYGKRFKSDGSLQAGSWSDWKLHGFGSIEMGPQSPTPGDFCICQMENGERSGKGAYFYRDGGLYVGLWRGNKKHGKGLNTWEDGTVYLGDYSEGVIHGHGCYLWSNGNVYIGNNKAGKRHGDGKMVFPGEYYDGQWSDNMRHGEGVCRINDGSLHRCLYSGDKHMKDTQGRRNDEAVDKSNMLKAEGERVYIEYCRDCGRHQWCTKHVEEKYSTYFNQCRSEILDLNPEVSVRGNEVPPTLRTKFTEEGVSGLPAIGRLSFPRMGAFEIFVRGKYLFSKLESGHWPHPTGIATKIKEVLDQLRLPPPIPESKRTTKKKKSKRKKKSKKASHSVSPITDRKASKDPPPRSDLTLPKQSGQTNRSLHEVEPPKMKTPEVTPPAKAAPEVKPERKENPSIRSQKPPSLSSSSKHSDTERFDVQTLHQEFKQADNYEDDYEDRFNSEEKEDDHQLEKDDYDDQEYDQDPGSDPGDKHAPSHHSEEAPLHHSDDHHSDDHEQQYEDEGSEQHYEDEHAGDQEDEQQEDDEPVNQRAQGSDRQEADQRREHQFEGEEEGEEDEGEGEDEDQLPDLDSGEQEEGSEQNYEDREFEEQHPKREVTKRFELELKVGVESNKKITYENKHSEPAVYTLSSSDEAVMEIKEPEVAIDGNGKGKFQLKFCAVESPCEVMVYLYVDEDESPVECIEITARFQD